VAGDERERVGRDLDRLLVGDPAQHGGDLLDRSGA
jgi:hypothetical protein